MSEKVINILLVEDDAADVMNVKRAFKKVKITNPVDLTSNGIEALNMLLSNSVQPPTVPPERHLVLLNLNKPKIGGKEFLSELPSVQIFKNNFCGRQYDLKPRPKQSGSLQFKYCWQYLQAHQFLQVCRNDGNS
ncbi:two-component response regulator [Calothrix sp. NIES-2098]|nr:two-component response regulator [Calothrix sp. NIES-2098]